LLELDFLRQLVVSQRFGAVLAEERSLVKERLRPQSMPSQSLFTN